MSIVTCNSRASLSPLFGGGGGGGGVLEREDDMAGVRILDAL